MGIFDGLFGKKESYPPLDPNSEAAHKVAGYEEALRSLASRSNDRLEAVPADDSLYVYVGKPPKQFGVVWYEGGEEYVFVEEMQGRGLSGERIQELSDELRQAYEANDDASRYSYQIGDKTVVVTPAPGLAKELDRVVGEVEA